MGGNRSPMGRLSMFDFIILVSPYEITLYINLKQFNNF